jgi:hypothetical protein
VGASPFSHKSNSELIKNSISRRVTSDCIVWLSEEISNPVAECTRLILVKEEFGGDLGALDRWADKHRKDIRILEWFRPSERNTLRPLGCCIDCGSLD